MYTLFSFSHIFYVNASSATTISTDLKSLARVNKGETEGDALTWLAQDDTNWLVLFDNADDTSLELKQYFPICSHGTIIITTRNHQMVNLASGPHTHYKVSGMSPQDAKELLLTASGVRVTMAAEKHSGILTLVRLLSFLCLIMLTVPHY